MRNYKFIYFIALFFVVNKVVAQTVPLSRQMADQILLLTKDTADKSSNNLRPIKWSYDQGVILEGIDAVWKRTGNAVYFKYMQDCMDAFVMADGTIKNYKQSDFNIDNVKNGRSLLTLYKVTGQQKYFKAATLLWDQLQQQPRTKEGGFWHKKIYPNPHVLCVD
eukprot:Opistho-2@28688